MSLIRPFLLVLLAIPLPAAGEAVRVLASIEPLRYLVERVGAGEVDVESVVKAGQRPETYEPTPRQVALLAEARVFFGVGMPLEAAWRRQAGAAGDTRDVRWVNLSEGLEDTGHAEVESQAGDGHDHEGVDPHTWLDPHNARRMVVAISEVLADAKPERAEMFAANAERLNGELEKLDREISAILADAGVGVFLVFHPAWGHFARAYGMEQIAVEAEGKEPGPKTLARIIDKAQREGIRTVFLEPQHGRRLAQTIAAAIGGEVAILDPLAYDYIDNLRQAALAIADSGS